MNKFAKILSEASKLSKVETLPDGAIRYEDDETISYCNWKREYHRLDGPAFINKTYNYEAWYLNGKLHRTNGPAEVNGLTGLEVYWVNGKRFTKEEFYKHFGNE